MDATKIALYALVLKYKEAVDYSHSNPQDPERDKDIEETFGKLQNFFRRLHD